MNQPENSTVIAMSHFLRAVMSAAWFAIAPASALAEPIYLNGQNMTVSLGPDMAADPFKNQTTEKSLANLIDAPSADAPEHHKSPSTHVWVSGGPLSLAFDFGIEYDLTTLHFWNYFSENYDVDRFDFRFFNAERMLVGELLDIEPRLGGKGGNPVWAEHYALSFPSRVRYVSAVLSGSNDEVDFTNIGFTGEVSPPPAATPAVAVPGQGTLSVVAGESWPQTAVELILDASGSMLQRIEGRRRIAIARDVLTQAVREYIPAGMPVALRVFGHREADACRTDLEIPLAPLDPEAAAARIAGINAMNLAKTPIAASLAAVEEDLRGAGSGVVVLVTDGEETCGGDPAAVIDSLKAKGFDVSLNIVGLAIDDAALAAQFAAWADAGDGRYFAADDQRGLDNAIERALRTAFTVHDQDGVEMATGEVGGDAVALDSGSYRVVVHGSPGKVFDAVRIEGDGTVILTLE